MFIPLHDHNALENIRLQYVTLALIIINVAIWLLTATPQLTDTEAANAYYYAFGFVPAVVNDIAVLPPEYAFLPEPLSYVSYAFFHGSFMHLAGNMLFLWVFGDNVEDAMGHLRFLVFYLVCAVAGAWAHLFANPGSEIPLIGASGAIAGMVGAYLMLHPKVKVWVLVFARIPLRLSAFWVLGGWIAFQVFSFFFDAESAVSWSAHIGGAVAGMILIPFFKYRSVPLFDRDLRAEGTEQKESRKKVPESDPVKSPHKWGR